MPHLILLGLMLVLEGGMTMPTQRVTNEAARAIILRLESEQNFTTAETMRLQAAPNVVPDLIAGIDEHYPSLRAATLPVLEDLGRPVVPAQGGVPERLAPFVDNPIVVAYLVRALTDGDVGIRNEACRALVEEVPDRLIREHADEIVAAVRRYPTVDGGVLLLGKTNAEEAKVLIADSPALRLVAPEDTEIALARLGDERAEEAVIRAYAAAQTPADKARQAPRLGYVGTRRAARVLARDVRTPEAYEWCRRARRSVRIHVIEGLHRAFLTEPLFWKPFFKPEDDAYYDAIEQWLKRNLDVTWDQPRPPFLYEEDAASAPGGPH